MGTHFYPKAFFDGFDVRDEFDLGEGVTVRVLDRQKPGE